jgi:archaellum component FlaG (FlaF/FlaG flagellin family)
MKRKFRRNLKGVSTVIATIIIVAISIVMAIAVAYWILGIGSSFTRFEKLEFTSGWAKLYYKGSVYPNNNSKNFANDTYVVFLSLKNTGSASAGIDPATIFYNGKPYNAYTTYAPSVNLTSTKSLDPGSSTLLDLFLPAQTGSIWVSSMSVEVMIQTTAGRQYPKVIVLP